MGSISVEANHISDGAPEGVVSILDTDLYKLNMQCAVLRHFPDVEVEYTFRNRTVDMYLDNKAVAWLKLRIEELEDLRLSDKELQYLQDNCKHLPPDYLEFLQSVRLKPKEQVFLAYHPMPGTNLVNLDIQVKGPWRETILYEIPILSLVSEAYFKFVDLDWTYEGQEQAAYAKCTRLLEAGCKFSEFGTRRRRDFRTQETVVAELVRAQQDHMHAPGKLLGTSNVFLAMKYGITPIGTVAHEWYMAIAAITQDYERANELGLKYWLDTFGWNQLSIALTDTFTTPSFFRDFRKRAEVSSKDAASSISSDENATYAHVYSGVRQDSGDPHVYVNMAASFYKSLGISGKRILFSDSLNVDKCVRLKEYAEQFDLEPSFGIGTFFSNDFQSRSNPRRKSLALNIVMKVSKAAGNHCVKISDGIGKAMGDVNTIQDVRNRLGVEDRLSFM